MNNFLKRNLKKLIITLVILFALNFYLSQNYSIIAPGITVDLKQIVSVEGGDKEEKGAFYLTTVSTRDINIPLFLYAFLSPSVEIEKKEDIIPPGWDMKKYIEYMKQWMEESQKIAEVVALKKAGYNPQILGNGAKVVEVIEDSPAKGKIFPGDVVKKVDGEKINIAEEMIKKVSNRKVGDPVTLEIDREGEKKVITIPTIESKTEKGKAMVGLLITTMDWKPILPKKIIINTGEISGPSAGLMFTLEILNQLLPEDLTKGKKIAGTGTISLDGTVGEIGGVKQKVLAAYRDKAEIFFVPVKNAEDAKKAAKNLNIKIIPVNNIDEVLNYLRSM
ncbi:SepM family pheromone-processing serine protease [Thermovenabulum gondwanense]|uniref:endopeptidase La n=1 Tax=Thermovenabulum gondwanense TaxID=520767 RepID=A0A161PV64_9FIRM|nr:SepM family pheromone-processing serine protease [Thermovenabulum gondwanense]KYO66766.1 Lon protease [Thermovenabulum gondwanense]